ncbi:MAG TPA: adenylate/guanylate cyclase domain-containing protein [Thermoleophilaceae bacterium]
MTERMEPEWAMVTVLFADIRGFTAYADRATAREAADHLSGFFEIAVPVVTRNGGEVNKLLGDGLLAVFRTPDHADRAVAAGVELLAAVGGHCRIGIGLNSGLVLVGTIGGGGMTELGVIGDPVNVAARVQDATRELGEPLLLTEATRLLLERDRTRLAPRGAIALRGKAAPVAVYGLAHGFVTLSGRRGRRKELA